MSLINCKKLRLFVVAAFALFLLGIVLQVPRMVLGEPTSLITLLSGMGLLAVVLSPIVMIIVSLLSLFPGASRKLNLCNH